MLEALGQLLANHRRRPRVARLRRAIASLHRAAENRNYDMATNGEAWLLRCLSAHHAMRVIFDVGANTGDWSRLALQASPLAHIHAFEVVPSTYARLQSALQHEERVRLVNRGLSDQAGSLAIHHDPAYPALATPVQGFSQEFHGYEPSIAQLPVSTGEAYCKEQGVDHIDLLKVDVEGHEPQVLRGFEALLRAGAVDIIQFEYGYVNIDTRFLLKDFYDYLGGLGMRIGKIFPNHVEFREYRYQHEDFYGPNFLAVRSDLDDVIRTLSGGAHARGR